MLHHSNPNVNYLGNPTGISGQDNSLSINNVRFTVSGFRDEPSCDFDFARQSIFLGEWWKWKCDCLHYEQL